MAIDLQRSILCDLWSNGGRGVKLPGRSICLDCAQADAELVREIVHFVMPEMGRSARRGAKCSRSRRALELRASGAVGSRWQPVFGSSDCLE